MQETTTICLDIAKSVFQVHGIDASGRVIVRRQTRPRSRSSSKSYVVKPRRYTKN